MTDREQKLLFSVEAIDAEIISQTLDVPFGVGLSMVIKEELGYRTDSSYTLLPGDTNDIGQEGVRILKKNT